MASSALCTGRGQIIDGEGCDAQGQEGVRPRLGQSVRAISNELGLSRNTVRKYLYWDERQISNAIADPSWTKQLDEHRDSPIKKLG